MRRCASATQSTRTSTIDDVTDKEGRTGKLVFVKVRHEVRRNGATRRRRSSSSTTSSIARREAPDDVAPPPQAAPRRRAWQREIVPDDVLLFRYSALTFNGHRIHYDRRYVTEVEGYPGLIVHGPLIATLLLDLLRRQRARGATWRRSGSRPCARPSTCIRSASAASRRPTARPSAVGARTTKAG